MTALCGGGASQPKPDFNKIIYIAPASLGAFLNNIPTPWAVALAGFIGAVTYDMSQLCLSDPPTLPVITDADCVALINITDPITYAAALAKWHDFIEYYLWFVACQCVSGSTPAASPGQSAPPNLPLINPPSVGPAYPTGQPCFNLQFLDVWSSGPNLFVQTANAPLPAGATLAAVHADTNVQAPGGSADNYCQILLMNSSGTIIANTSAGFSFAGFTTDSSVAIPSTATQYAIRREIRNNSQYIYLNSAVSLYCGTTPGGGGGYSPPCPPDEFSLALLQQILGMVTLIQRQDAAFGYIRGTVHAGLSGSGEIAIQGLIGALVTITSSGPYTGIESADPDLYFEAGWFSWGNADGFSTRTLINCSPQISLPAQAGQYTRIAYTLPVGVTISVTELVREP